MILVGIDPGTVTGLATWSTQAKALGVVTSMQLHQAMDYLRAMPQAGSGDMVVVWEDCRNHRVFGAAQRNAGALQGVGSVKRDCGIWEEFLTDARIPYITRAPSRRRTKFTRDQFQAATGWTERSNNHGRDAAMLVAGVTDTMAQAWRAQALQRFTIEGKRA